MDVKESNLKRRVYLYALKIIKFVEKLPKDPANKIMSNQLLRSGTSVAANIVEAQGAGSKKDFVNFYHYSLKSANESKLWIGLLRDADKVEKAKAEYLLEETKEVANMIASSILTIKGKKKI